MSGRSARDGQAGKTLPALPALAGVTVFYAAAFFVLTWPAVTRFRTHWFADDGDGLQNVWNVWWVSRRTGQETRVTSYTGVDTFVRYPTSSPRGDRVVFEVGEVRGNIWLSTLPAPGESDRWAAGRYN